MFFIYFKDLFDTSIIYFKKYTTLKFHNNIYLVFNSSAVYLAIRKVKFSLYNQNAINVKVIITEQKVI